MDMFCCQCEETVEEQGCTKIGVCGKDSEIAALQDLLAETSLRLGAQAHKAKLSRDRKDEVQAFFEHAFFQTVTNVNFDPADLVKSILHLDSVTGSLGGERLFEDSSLDQLTEEAQRVTVQQRRLAWGDDCASLGEILIHGIKGMVAYAHHARILGQSDPNVATFVFEASSVLISNSPSADTLLDLCMRCGAVNMKVMEMLDAAHRERFGIPTPKNVPLTPTAGPAILISGHDLEDLYHLLEQTKGLGINIYTHSEMLPAHGYPKLADYPHLYGNFGGAWHQQWTDFDSFPGPIVMTSNCIQRPKDSYKDRIYTCGPVGWPGIKHIENYDFSAVIEKAHECKGFPETDTSEEKTVLTGFGREAILGAAEAIIGAVKSGDLKRFFLVGGCDGRKKERSYYTEFTEAIPDDCVILTLGCAKYRFMDKDFGDIGGIPRYLDLGQCNDAYGAIRVAGALADAFGTDVNSLPLTLNISWYEQKAVCILLSLLHLGIRNIKLGPTLPAFISPGVLEQLVSTFNIGGITQPKADLERMMV